VLDRLRCRERRGTADSRAQRLQLRVVDHLRLGSGG
jgi:hypothetical protein